jgi:hypothetical protein
MIEVNESTAVETTRAMASTVEEESVHIEQSAVGVVRAGRVTLGKAGVGAVFASGDVDISQGGGRTFVAAGDLRIQKGGGGMFLAGGNAEIREGGVGTLVALGDATIERGGTGVAATRSLELRDGAFLGFALTPRVTVHPGGRVLVGLREAGLAGAVAGLMIGAVLLLARRGAR